MAADRIHVAEPAPAHCSACFQAKPQMPHIDFGAAWDGPVVPGEGVVQHVIDDLIICQDCLVRAGILLDLGNVTAITAELRRAEDENDDLLAKNRQLRGHIENLEAVRNGRPNELLDSPKRQQRKRVAA